MKEPAIDNKLEFHTTHIPHLLKLNKCEYSLHGGAWKQNNDKNIWIWERLNKKGWRQLHNEELLFFFTLS